jgi:SNF2 family DNA or RNA helicase
LGLTLFTNKAKIEELRDEIRRMEREDAARLSEGSCGLAADAKVCEIQTLPDIPILGTDTWSHQLRAFWFLYHKLDFSGRGGGGALLAMDMGTGKTKVAIDAIQNYGRGQYLVTCPLAVVPTWPEEFATHAADASQFRVVSLDRGSVAKREATARAECDTAAATGQSAVFVINHESVWREPFRSFVLGRNWDGFIVDECHRAKSPGGKFSKFTHLVSCRSTWRLGLTGTPMPRDQMDLYAQGRFLDSNVYGTSFTKFKAHFGIWADIKTKKKDVRGERIVVRKLVGIRNEAELQGKLDHLSYRVEADDVLDLPPAVHQTRYCQLDAKEKKAYRELKNDLITQIDDGFVTANNILTKILRLQQVAQGVIQDESGKEHRVGKSKQKLLKDTLLDLDKDEPVVVFCRFHSDLDQVHEVCEDLGRGCLELSGRRKQLQEFKRGEEPVIAVQIRSGDVGVDLSRAAYSIYFCPTYDGGAFQQSLRRTRRPTKHLHGSFIYIYLVAEGTIDKDVYAALQRKEDLSDRVFAGIRGKS